MPGRGRTPGTQTVRTPERGEIQRPYWLCPYSEVRGPVAGLRIHPDMPAMRAAA
jgi:hypothetical protein